MDPQTVFKIVHAIEVVSCVFCFSFSVCLRSATLDSVVIASLTIGHTAYVYYFKKN